MDNFMLVATAATTTQVARKQLYYFRHIDKAIRDAQMRAE